MHNLPTIYHSRNCSHLSLCGSQLSMKPYHTIRRVGYPSNILSIYSLSPCAWSPPLIVVFSVVALFRTYTHYRNGSIFLSSYHRFTIMRGVVCYCTAFSTHSLIFRSPALYCSRPSFASLSFYATTSTQPRTPRSPRVLPFDVVPNSACFNSSA